MVGGGSYWESVAIFFLVAWNEQIIGHWGGATLKLGRDVKHFNFANGDVCKSCVIYKGDCSCGSRYIGEIKCNAEVRWNEDDNATKSSKPSKHIRNNINHYLHSVFRTQQKICDEVFCENSDF